MKKTTTLLTLLLSLFFLFPTFSCQQTDSITPSIPPSAEDSTQSGSNSDSSDEENEENEDTNDTPQETPPSTEPDTTPPITEPDNSSPPPETPTPPVLPTSQYIKCTGNSVNIRKGAGTSFSVLGQAEEGTMYAVTGKIGNWYQTFYRNQVAYIYAEYASVFTLEKTPSEKTESVIEEGYKLLGVPYVYGAVRLHNGKGQLLSGFSVQKFDCSSLIQYIFYKGADVLLDVTTRTQVVQGKYVHPNDLQRGDCIFFTNDVRENKTGIERVGHVAIYLGNNYILHTASDYARIEPISAKRWSHYIEARRFI